MVRSSSTFLVIVIVFMGFSTTFFFSAFRSHDWTMFENSLNIWLCYSKYWRPNFVCTSQLLLVQKPLKKNLCKEKNSPCVTFLRKLLLFYFCAAILFYMYTLCLFISLKRKKKTKKLPDKLSPFFPYKDFQLIFLCNSFVSDF